MFIAHLPAAYLLSRCHPGLTRVAPALLIGSVLPDVDMFWFAFVDSSTHHHHLITHRPAVWIAVLVCGLFWTAAMGLGLGALLHLSFDSIAGQIAWGWPLTHHATPLVEVPARYEWWVWSFLTHWTFALEIVICLAAAWVCRRHTLREAGP